MEEFLSELPRFTVQEDQPLKTRSRRSMERSQDLFSGDPPVVRVLREELQLLRSLATLVRKDLMRLRDMLVAKIDFMGEMEEVLQCIRANAVPSRWQKRSFPSCRPLSVWLIGLKIRAQWLEAAWGQRGHEPLCYRLDLFWRPRLLLLSHLRVAAQKENISLDSYSFKHKVLDRIEEEEDVQDHPASGLYVVGIFLKGASWERKRARLVDHRPEELFYKMPVIHFIPSANYKPKLYKHYGLPFFHAEHFCKLSADGEDSNFITEVLLRSDRPKDCLLKSVALFCELAS